MEALFWLQQTIREALTAEFARYAATPNAFILLWLVPLGIVFGAAHALTPGHSKLMLASYVLGSRLSAMRSLTVSMALAFVHVATAVIIALTTAAIVKRTIAGAGRAPVLEIASGLLLAMFGLWLVWRGILGRPHVHNEGLAMGAVAGLIPCPLTLFAMFYAHSRGVPEIGVAFAATMMLGVALTLSAVAFVTAFARERIIRFADRHGSAASRLLRSLDVTTGVLLVIGGAVRAYA
jgi:nickel/cobalt exporter